MELIISVFAFLGGLIGGLIPYIISKQERKDKFRFVAIERRLEAYQKAYSISSNFLDIMCCNDEEKINRVYRDAEDFFSKNSLYLENMVRIKFTEAMGFIREYCPKHKYLNEFVPNERKKALESFHIESNKLFELAKHIQLEVRLEPINPELYLRKKQE